MAGDEFVLSADECLGASWVALPTCAAKELPIDATGFVAFDINATFSEGVVAGHVYATHCQSLDAP